MALKFSTGLKNQLFNSIKGEIAASTYSLKNGVIYIYSGTQPATADAAATGTLLMVVTVGSGAFVHGTATNGLDFDAPAAGVMAKAAAEVWSGVGLADAGTGTTAGWFRHCGNPADNQGISTTLPRIDGRISTSGAEMSLSNLTIVQGASTTVDTYSLSWPSTL
jgi:hypothetical protein